ncbi:MAG: HAD family phosphatase [Anaerolineales bacterium]|nr:HAD family phosphatase [Anaerolineales bacterium]
MIQAVIFDFGGVLVRTHDHKPRRAWDRRLGLAPGEGEELVFNSEAGQQAQRGAITNEALWQWVGEHLQLTADDLAAFQQAFWAGDVLDTALVDAIRALRPFYQTALISNATDGLRPILSAKYPIADAFDLIVISAEEKIMKPAPEIYERTLQRLGRRPQETVFVDDFAHNIAGAQRVGMHGLHYTPGLDVPAALARLGVAARTAIPGTPAVAEPGE